MDPTANNSRSEGAGSPASSRTLDRLDRALTLVALYGGGLTLAFLTLLNVFNVLIMRKAFNAPIKGAEDLLVLALVVLVALAIPFGARTGAHIEIEVLDAALSKTFGRVSLIVMKAFGAIILAIMSWRLFDAGSNAALFGESSQTLLISFAPFYYMLSVSVGLYCIVLLLEIRRLLRTGDVRRLSMPGASL
jgi:TRAP-type C4-dicarboxylate transport system permease small subunit